MPLVAYRSGIIYQNGFAEAVKQIIRKLLGIKQLFSYFCSPISRFAAL
jgi:hypothetical protein